MDTVSVKDFLVRDLLAELRIKPWWEKCRGYGFAVTCAAAFAITCLPQTKLSMSCWPNDIDTENDFKTNVYEHVNFYCLAQMSKWVSLSGLLAGLLCCVVYFFSSWWLLIPEVIGALKSYAEFRKVIKELGITPEKLKILTSRSNEGNNGKLEKAYEAFKSLEDHYNNLDGKNFQRLSKAYCFLSCKDITLPDLYKQRNIILLFILLVTLAMGVVLFFTSFQEETYSCVISNHESAMNDESAISGEYECVEKVPLLTKALWLGFLAGVLFEIIFTYSGLRETRDERCNKYNNKFLNFTEILWMGSQSSDSNFEKVCRFMFREERKWWREILPDQTKPNAGKAMEKPTETAEESRPTGVINDTRITISSSTVSRPTSQTTKRPKPAKVFRLSRPNRPADTAVTYDEPLVRFTKFSRDDIIDISRATHSVHNQTMASGYSKE